MTAEIGRQPWLIYGLMRTSEGYSNTVSAGNGLFTLIGFMGLYALLACSSPCWSTAKSATARRPERLTAATTQTAAIAAPIGC